MRLSAHTTGILDWMILMLARFSRQKIGGGVRNGSAISSGGAYRGNRIINIPCTIANTRPNATIHGGSLREQPRSGKGEVPPGGTRWRGLRRHHHRAARRD